MATKQQRNARLIESIDRAEHTSLEAVRRFLDTVHDAFPHLSDDKPRRKIIDSAFEMTEHLVGSATRFAQNLMDITQTAVTQSEQEPAKKARARTTKKAAAKKSSSSSKKAPTTRASARKTSTAGG